MARLCLTVALAIAALLLAACGGSAATVPPSAAPVSTSPMTASPAGPSPTVSATPTTTPTASPTPTPTPGPTLAENVPFTPRIPCAADPAWEDAICQLEFDIAAPPAGTGPHPVAVLLRGGPAKPHDIDYLRDPAVALAQRGVVAMVADWRQNDTYAGSGDVPFQDIACAIGVARKIAPEYGGDPNRVTLIGHSNGGWGGGVVAFSPTTFKPLSGTCDETTGSLRPDAFIGVETWLAPEVADAAPRDPEHPIPILVVHDEGDPNVPVDMARAFVARMKRLGYHPELVMLPGGDHISSLYDKAALDRMAAFAGG